MAWLRIDDRVRTNLKIVKAGPAAAWLWFCGICYCREQLTDGFIPHAMVPTLAPGLKGTKRLVKALVDANLWHEREDGFAVHDFLEWNPSKAEVEAAREQDRRRKKGAGSASDSNEIPDGSRSDVSHARAGDAGLGSVLASDRDQGFPEESARETGTQPARRGARGGALMGGGSYLTHQKHGACNDRGLCVPQFLHDEFIAKAGGDAVHVAGFYAAELAALAPNVMPGDDAITFWRNAWRRTHATSTGKTGLVDKLRTSDDAAKAILHARGHR